MKSATLLVWSLAMQEGDDPRVQDLIFQIDQEVDRLPQQLGRLPCMTPKGVYYSTKRNQVLNANTCAGTQGFTEDILKDYFEHVEAHMVANCAGDAFTVTTVVCSALVAMVDLCVAP